VRGTITLALSAKIPRGTVMGQSRRSGATLPLGAAVDVVVSAGRIGRATVETRSAPVKRSRVAVALQCPKASDNPCAGKLRLLAGKHWLASTAFTVAAGKRSTVQLTLGPKVARSLRRRTVKAGLELVYRDEDGKARTIRRKLVLKG
jgi:hypothetical protein